LVAQIVAVRHPAGVATRSGHAGAQCAIILIDVRCLVVRTVVKLPARRLGKRFYADWRMALVMDCE
jgi:hypothetical protein